MLIIALGNGAAGVYGTDHRMYEGLISGGLVGEITQAPQTSVKTPGVWWIV